MLDRIPDTLCVCLCTYRRADQLARLLRRLAQQENDGRFILSIVVVDNDPLHSARDVLQQFAAQTPIPFRYLHEPVANIARARNLAVQEAQATWLAFLDDDEMPPTDWLLQLLMCVQRTDADGALGPVLPEFDSPPPRWLQKARFCERHNPPADAELRSTRLLRTGNVLIRAQYAQDRSPAFDERLGITGGEDVEFFAHQLRQGRRFVWCRTAAVLEHVPWQRMTRQYWIRRALLRGVANAHHASILSADTARSVAALIIYTSLLPMVALWPHHLFMQLLIRHCDHLGKVLARMGWRIQSSRPAPG